MYCNRVSHATHVRHSSLRSECLSGGSRGAFKFRGHLWAFPRESPGSRTPETLPPHSGLPDARRERGAVGWGTNGRWGQRRMFHSMRSTHMFHTLTCRQHTLIHFQPQLWRDRRRSRRLHRALCMHLHFLFQRLFGHVRSAAGRRPQLARHSQHWWTALAFILRNIRL